MEVDSLCKAIFKEKDSLSFEEFKKGCEEVTSEMFLSVLFLNSHTFYSRTSSLGMNNLVNLTPQLKESTRLKLSSLLLG
jgi:hypothetical protein